MRAPLLRCTPSFKYDSWLTRVRENLRQLLTPAGLFPSSANGAPIHLLKLDRTHAPRRAQTVSLLTHVGVVGAIALLAMQAGPNKPPSGPIIDIRQERLLFAPPSDIGVNKPSLGHAGGGGDNTSVPATRGFLAPHSPVQLAAPRLPDNANHQLPVPVTILDAQAPPVITSLSDLGLPWMPKETNSAGPGKNGIGSSDKGGMGDREGPYAGDGEDERPYANGVSMPTCNLCPYPVYTDEARHVKVQGTVMLRVLVGADGRASEIRVVRGVGYGLEERAVQTVRGWKFSPARDARRRPVAAWVIIEAVFRLF
jgi:protein TonB